jgi:hypothetical protein
MFRLSDEHIDFIESDLRHRGIRTEDLQNNLLDHICCSIENELEESGDFHSFYALLIRRFYHSSLSELEEETQALLTFKHYYLMKMTLLISGTLSAAFFVLGIIFKFQHFPGAAMLLVSGVFLLSFVFLPLLFLLKFRQYESGKDRLLITIAGIAAFCMSLAPIFKSMHWRGANMLAVTSLVALVFIYLPIFFVRGIRRPESRFSTITTSILIVAGSALFMALAQTPYGNKMENQRATSTYIRGEQILHREKQLSGGDISDSLGNQINSRCENLKREIIRMQTGKVVSDLSDDTSLYLENELIENYFNEGNDCSRISEELKNLVAAYNVKPVIAPISLNNTFLEKQGDRVIKSLNDLIQIQMQVLQDDRIKKQTALK